MTADQHSGTGLSARPLGLLVALGLLAAGCSQNMNDLEQYRDDVLARQSGRIEALPQIKPYETHSYSAAGLRSPFEPDAESAGLAASAAGESGVRPDSNRSREFLEEYPLDTLRMVGTMNLRGQDVALVQDPDGLIHQVRPGNYMGQNHGRIVEMNDSEIRLIEIISDGLGGWIERPAAIALSD